jgi:2-polyprenyl-3-methyl-5-hydroxy-6-metoxy-1,4-benzoquinol methylase
MEAAGAVTNFCFCGKSFVSGAALTRLILAELQQRCSNAGEDAGYTGGNGPVCVTLDVESMAPEIPHEQIASVNPGYYKNDRAEMISFLPPDPKRLIDIGCGEGLFGAAVKARFPDCEIWGVELIADVAKKAAARNDRIIQTSFEKAAELPEAYFDVVTMNDVLEHIPWPEPALATARRILRPSGKLVLSLPNVQFFLNVLDLVKRNDWKYQDSGILDRTHFRFYTTKSATRLLEQNGFKVEQVTGINPIRPKWYYRLLFAVAPKYFYWMPFFQFAIVARPLG